MEGRGSIWIKKVVEAGIPGLRMSRKWAKRDSNVFLRRAGDGSSNTMKLNDSHGITCMCCTVLVH